MIALRAACWLSPWLLGACSSEPGIVLTIALAPGANVEEVTVQFTATSRDGSACAPATIALPSRCLPWDLAVSPGERFAERFVLLADATRDGEVIATREKIIRFAAAERLEDEVLLDPACAERCGLDRRCEGDACVPSADARGFLEGIVVEIDETPCLATEPADRCP